MNQQTGPIVTFTSGENMRPYYYRNNRSDGLKNLQCFPYCGEVHVSKQFCGSSIKISLQMPR
jgi:hypothetical protein